MLRKLSVNIQMKKHQKRVFKNLDMIQLAHLTSKPKVYSTSVATWTPTKAGENRRMITVTLMLLHLKIILLGVIFALLLVLVLELMLICQTKWIPTSR